MARAESVLGTLGPSAAALIRDREDAARLAQLAGFGSDFLLLLVNTNLSLLDVWRVPRDSERKSSFPFATAVQLAAACRAAGIIVVQDRRPDNPVAPRADVELTKALREAFAETGVELIDHLLLTADGYRTVAGPIFDKA